nr:acidic leucine-rich nuclear phosphoprotein 32-related protein-like [Aegilops tauschii subsp. strangulata]
MPPKHSIGGNGDAGAAKALEHSVEMETEVAFTSGELSLHPDVVDGVERPQPEAEFHTDSDDHSGDESDDDGQLLLLLALPHSLLWCPDSSSVNPEDVDAIIQNIAKAAEADAEKIAAEEATKGAVEDAAKGPAGEAGKAAAEETDKGPSGEADLQKRVAETQDWLRWARNELKAAQGELAKRDVELTMKLADVEKVKELDVERDGLKEQALKLSREKDTLNGALTEAQGAAISRAGELSEANKSIKDLTLKLDGLEGMLTEANAREGALAKELETEKQLQKNEAAEHKDFKEGIRHRRLLLQPAASSAKPAAPKARSMDDIDDDDDEDEEEGEDDQDMRDPTPEPDELDEDIVESDLELDHDGVVHPDHDDAPQKQALVMAPVLGPFGGSQWTDRMQEMCQLPLAKLCCLALDV